MQLNKSIFLLHTCFALLMFFKCIMLVCLYQEIINYFVNAIKYTNYILICLYRKLAHIISDVNCTFFSVSRINFYVYRKQENH